MKSICVSVIALAICVGGGAAMARADTELSDNVEAEKAEALRAQLQWLAQEPAPDPVAEDAFQAWLVEREAILSGKKKGSEEWHAWVRDYRVKAEAADTPFIREVYERVALDQYGRYSHFHSPERSAKIAEDLGHPLEGDSVYGFQDRVMKLLMRTDRENTAFLKAALETRNGQWWAISEVGTDVSGKLWLMTQHADLDRGFQRRALALMKPLIETGEIDREDYGYLLDRIAVADGQPQTFGTQGQCVAPGDWEAFEIEAPVEDVNQRRAAFDFKMTFEENDDRLDDVCVQ